MEPGYEDFLYRVIEERERLGLEQRTVAAGIGLSQSHYSKNELGKNRFSYHNLKLMSKLDIDLYYVFTGNRLNLKIGNDSIIEQRFFLENIFVAISDFNTYTFSDDVRKRLDYIKYVSYFSFSGNKSIFKILSAYEGMTQNNLAYMLGIDQKKLRRLQKREIMPDSELIYRTLNTFGISPMIILEDDNCALYQADYVLRLLDNNQEKRVLEYLERFTA